MTIYRSDAEIKKDIVAELSRNPEVKGADIDVIIKNGSVKLLGTVLSSFQKTAAKASAKRIRSVRNVDDELEVRVPYESPYEDEEIAKRIKYMLRWNREVPEEDFSIEVHKGIVDLNGEVDWQYQRCYVEEQIQAIRGVRFVMNSLDIRARITATNIPIEILKTLQRYEKIDINQVFITEEAGIVTLAGNVENFQQRDAIENTAWSTIGVTDVINNLYISYTASAIEDTGHNINGFAQGGTVNIHPC